MASTETPMLGEKFSNEAQGTLGDKVTCSQQHEIMPDKQVTKNRNLVIDPIKHVTRTHTQHKANRSFSTLTTATVAQKTIFRNGAKPCRHCLVDSTPHSCCQPTPSTWPTPCKNGPLDTIALAGESKVVCFRFRSRGVVGVCKELLPQLRKLRKP